VQLTTLLVETFKSGKITVCQNDVEELEITARNKKIDVNTTDKKIINEIISGTLKGSSKGGLRRSFRGIKAVREARPLLKEIVDDLSNEGITVTISFKGDRVATMGSEANSKFTRYITGTKHVEINNAARLLEMTF
jgi:hypothetical protein